MMKQIIFAATLLLTLGIFAYTVNRLLGFFKFTRKNFPVKRFWKKISG